MPAKNDRTFDNHSNENIDLSKPEEETQKDCETAQKEDDRSDIETLFSRLWPIATHDRNLALYGFRRYKTIHLLNLRFLENEIEKIDRKIYQGGLSIRLPHTTTDRLGLRHNGKDSGSSHPLTAITKALVLQMRELLKQYGTTVQMEAS